ncbi:MAG TPA: alpha/beta hydrolase [Telluria sp.]|nr:alpha/beta hydrolase [Telluria sp.]
MHSPVLIVPGINNSGESHWQTLWQRRDPGFERLAVDDWDNPACSAWVEATGSAALLVAVPDPAGPAFPPTAHGFAPLPARRFAFPSLIVASSDDPYASADHTRDCARAWGSHVHQAGPRGHLNGASGLGEWPAGWALLESLRARVGC